MINNKKLFRIFDKEITLKKDSCCNDGKELKDQVNIFVKITNTCNCSCKFCSNQTCSDKINFDKYKFYFIVDQITRKYKLPIGRISFTGGEPTLNIDLLNELISQIKFCDSEIFIGMNTNGSFLKSLEKEEIYNILENFDGISFSRHSPDENINKICFNSDKIPSKNDLKNIPSKFKRKLHLSAILQKDILETKEQIIEYLKFADELGICDVGFVSLMKVNNFSKEKFVDFKDIDLSNIYEIEEIRKREFCGMCRCNEYVYIPSSENSNYIRFYNRYYYDNNESVGSLVFDGEYLRKGFDGEIII